MRGKRNMNEAKRKVNDAQVDTEQSTEVIRPPHHQSHSSHFSHNTHPSHQSHPPISPTTPIPPISPIPTIIP